MNKVKKVNGFQTSDGKFFESAEEAEAHQYNIDIKEALQNFGGEHFFNDMPIGCATEILMDNAEQLRDIFNKIQGNYPLTNH